MWWPEAEVYASFSAACDAVLLARILNFITGFQVMIHHLLDSSAARGILRRQGVGRIRHLSCHILWLQNLVKHHRDFKTKEVDGSMPIMAHDVAAVSGLTNVADLGTKCVGKKRLLELMRYCNLGTLGTMVNLFHSRFQSMFHLQKTWHSFMGKSCEGLQEFRTCRFGMDISACGHYFLSRQPN